MKISYAPFWKTLKQKGLNQYVLINKMGVRNSLVHKLRHDLDIRLTTLADLCEKLIYLFDLEEDIQEAIWQEDTIYRNREFPKGSLERYYGKFVREHVFAEDREKMQRAGSPEFLRQTLSEENPVYDVDFRRIYPDRSGSINIVCPIFSRKVKSFQVESTD